MDIRIYSPLQDGDTFEGNQIGIVQANRIQFTESLYDVGNFTLELSAKYDYADMLKEGNLIQIGDLWGILRETQDENTGLTKPMTRHGDCLKGYLWQRITIYPKEPQYTGTNGYDAVMGSTEKVMKHYIANNLASPLDPKRKIPNLIVAQDQNRGAADDKYMSRFDRLDTLLSTIGEAEQLGCRVIPDFAQNALVFDVVQGADRTVGQRDRPPILIDVNLATAQNSRYYTSVRPYRNLFYTTKSGGKLADEALTQVYWRDTDPAEPQGRNRYETNISVSIGSDVTDTFAEMKRLCEKEMTRFEREETFVVENTESYTYNKDYFLGDFVTLQDRFYGICKDVQLIAITHEWSGAGYRQTALYGKPRQTNFDLLERQILTEGR